MDKLINFIGLLFTFLCSLSLARGLFISRKEAIELGVPRWAGESNEENLKLPQVQDRLRQKQWGIIGAILLFIGFAFQIIGLFIFF